MAVADTVQGKNVFGAVSSHWCEAVRRSTALFRPLLHGHSLAPLSLSLDYARDDKEGTSVGRRRETETRAPGDARSSIHRSRDLAALMVTAVLAATRGSCCT
jgi:hypothetical protein